MERDTGRGRGRPGLQEGAWKEVDSKREELRVMLGERYS